MADPSELPKPPQSALPTAVIEAQLPTEYFGFAKPAIKKLLIENWSKPARISPFLLHDFCDTWYLPTVPVILKL